MMNVLYNPLRFIQGDNLASYPSVLSFYEDFLRRLWTRYPKGFIDIMHFVESETPFNGPVVKNFWNDCQQCITVSKRSWFFDPYVLEVDWQNRYECQRRLKWLAETLILVVNHRIEPCWTDAEQGNSFDDAFDKFYKKIS